MEIKRSSRMSDGTIFRIYDDLPYMGHYYTIEYARFIGDCTYWFKQTEGRIATIEDAYRQLYELTMD